MKHMDLKTILDDYNEDAVFTLCLGEVTIPSGKRIYSVLSAKYEIIANSVSEDCYRKMLTISDWQKTEELQSIFNYYAERIADEIASDAISIKFYGLDRGTVIKMCEKEGYFDHVYSMIIEFTKQCVAIGEAINLSASMREEAKENRARLETLTVSNSVGTAVKNQLKTDVVNAAMGWLYSAANNSANKKERQAALDKIKSLFANLIIQLHLALYPAYKKMFNIIILMLEDQKPGIISRPTVEDFNLAQNIFNNMITLNISHEQKCEMARQIITLSPDDISYFNEMYKRFANHRTEIFNGAKLCGHDLSRYIEETEKETIRSMLGSDIGSVETALNYLNDLKSNLDLDPYIAGKLLVIINEHKLDIITRNARDMINSDPAKYSSAVSYIRETVASWELDESYCKKAEKSLEETYRFLILGVVENYKIHTTEEAKKCFAEFSKYADSIQLIKSLRSECEAMIITKLSECVEEELAKMYDASYDSLLRCENMLASMEQKYGEEHFAASEKLLSSLSENYRTINGVKVDTNEDAFEIKTFISQNQELFDKNHSFSNRSDIESARDQIKDFMSKYPYPKLEEIYLSQINNKLKKYDTENAEQIIANPPQMIFHSDYEDFIRTIQSLPLSQQRINEVVQNYEGKLRTFEKNCKDAALYANKTESKTWFLSGRILKKLIIALVIAILGVIGAIDSGEPTYILFYIVVFFAYGVFVLKGTEKKWKTLTQDGKYKIEDIAAVKYPDKSNAPGQNSNK